MNYPQSSCPSNQCGPPSAYRFAYETSNTIPSSLAISGCKTPHDLEYCTSKQMYNQTLQTLPTEQSKPISIPLNQLNAHLETDGYYKVNCSRYKSGCREGFVSSNPLTMDAPRGQRLVLDRPPLSGGIEVGHGSSCHDKLYSRELSEYGKNYTNYSDITAGDIQYWVATDNMDAYWGPVYSTPAVVDHILFIDPMGVVRPEYKRTPLKRYDWDSCHPDSCDSYTHDQIEFREQLMASQSRKRDESDYAYRWASQLT